jgi:hypothetical protein
MTAIMKMFKKVFSSLCFFLMCFATQGVAFAQDGAVGHVDSILDRLEKRLLDQEADGLTFGERQSDPGFLKSSPEKTSKKFKFKGGKVEASTPDKDKLKAIDLLIKDLERQVDQLAGNVQKTKQTVVDEAAVNNYVSVDAELIETDRAAIKSLQIKLDGYDLYSLSDAAGMWLPSKSVPVYAGPLQPGAHRLDLEVRLVLRQNPELPLNGDVYRFISKSFTLKITGASSKSRFVIAIKPPEKLDENPDATIKEII